MVQVILSLVRCKNTAWSESDVYSLWEVANGLFSGAKMAVNFREGRDFHRPSDRIASEWAMAMLHKWTVLQPVLVPFRINAKPSNRKTACMHVIQLLYLSTITILEFSPTFTLQAKTFFFLWHAKNSTNLSFSIISPKTWILLFPNSAEAASLAMPCPATNRQFPRHLGMKKLPDQQICMAKLTLRAGFHLRSYEKWRFGWVWTPLKRKQARFFLKQFGTNHKRNHGWFEIICQRVKWNESYRSNTKICIKKYWLYTSPLKCHDVQSQLEKLYDVIDDLASQWVPWQEDRGDHMCQGLNS